MAACFVFAAARLASHAGSLAPNGDFEKEDHGALAAWMPLNTIIDKAPNNVNGISDGYADIVWDTDSSSGGHGSLLIRGTGNRHSDQQTDTCVISPKIPVQENKRYKFIYSWKANGLMAERAGRYCCLCPLVQCFAGNGRPGYANYWYGRLWNTYDRDRDKMLAEEGGRMQAQNSTEWQTAEYDFTTPAATTDLQIELRVSSTVPSHPFSVWFDNVSIVPAAEAVNHTSAVAAGPAATLPDDPAFDIPAMSPQSEWIDRTMPPRTARGLETGDINYTPPAAPYGSGIQRVMKLLATSTPQRRNRVNIMIYGQSIVEDYRDQRMRLLIDDLRSAYPYADIVTENLALGGFTSDNLRITAGRDFSSVYPDLVILHDYSYGDDDALREENTEAVYSALHDDTTAEMLALTHHLSHPGIIDAKPPYNYFHWNGVTLDRDSDLIRSLARKYGYEVADMRADWKKFLTDTCPAAATDENALRMRVLDYLQDQVHQNPRGGLLMERIALRHFQEIPNPKPNWTDQVKVYTPNGQEWPQTSAIYPSGGMIVKKPMKLDFVGNRVDLLAMPITDGKPGGARVLIDGKPPSSFPEVYVPTRTTQKPTGGWPMITRIDLGTSPAAQDWTLTYTKVDPAKSRSDVAQPDTFHAEFRLSGSVTGPDGSGDTRERFVSKSGQITLDPRYNLKPLFLAGYIPPVGFQVKWSVVAQAMDIWQQRSGVDPTLEDRYTLAQGLPNTRHTLEVIPNGDGPIGLRAIVAYHPRSPIVSNDYVKIPDAGNGKSGPALMPDPHVVQIDVGKVLNARTVTTFSAGLLIPYSCSIDGVGSVATKAAADALKLPDGHTLPDDGNFPSNACHPQVVLNYSNVDGDGNQVRSSPLKDDYSFGVPSRKYARMLLFFAGAGSPALHITLTYKDGSAENRRIVLPNAQQVIDTTTGKDCFYLARNLANWSLDSQIYGQAQHNILGFDVQPSAKKVLTRVEVHKEMGIVSFWGATGVTSN